MRRIGAWTLGLVVTTSLAATSSAAEFTDPAPPQTTPLPAMEPPTAQDNSNTTFHSPPKPLPPGAKTGDWTSFLGAHHNLVCDESKLLSALPAGGPQIVWEMKRGSGYGGPAILGPRLVLLHRVEDEEVAECLEAHTGKRFWRFSYPTAYQDRYGYNDGPRCSPAIDPSSEAVFTLGAEGKLHCLELKTGRLRWKRNLAAEFKVPQQFFGWGCTPLVEGGRLIVNVGGGRGPCVAAFDVATGKLLWGAGDQWGPSYASPIPADLHGKHRVLVFAGGESDPPTGGLLCIDPADGKVDFEFPWRGTRRESVNASTPLVVGDNKVFISESYGSGGALLQILPPNDQGKLGVRTVWTNPNFGTHFMTVVENDGCLYGVDGHGPNDAFLVCVDLATGEEKWRTQPEWTEEVPSRTGGGVRQMTLGTYRAWLMKVDGRMLMQGEFGHLLWVDLSPKGFTPISRSWLFRAGETWTPPVVSRGLLYVNQNSPAANGSSTPRLICYDLRGEPATK